MTVAGWLTIILFVVILTALAFPIGTYMSRVYTGERVFLSPIFAGPERFLLSLMRVDHERGQDWKSYANLHALQSENPAIVEGFIWASLCAAFIQRTVAHVAQRVLARPISTRLAAMSGPQLLPLIAAWARSGFRAARLRNILFFIGHNALPTHPERRRPHDALGLRYDRCKPCSLPSCASLAVRAAA